MEAGAHGGTVQGGMLRRGWASMFWGSSLGSHVFSAWGALEAPPVPKQREKGHPMFLDPPPPLPHPPPCTPPPPRPHPSLRHQSWLDGELLDVRQKIVRPKRAKFMKAG